MSGGSFGYFYRKLSEFADDVFTRVEYTEQEKLLSDLCRDLSDVCKAVEWWKSGGRNKEHFIDTFEQFRKVWLRK